MQHAPTDTCENHVLKALCHDTRPNCFFMSSSVQLKWVYSKYSNIIQIHGDVQEIERMQYKYIWHVCDCTYYQGLIEGSISP